jgi:AAA domain
MIDLTDHIEAIARQLEAEGRLGERTKGFNKRDELRFGAHGSLSIVIGGSGRGDWYDHEIKQGGGPRELIEIKGGYDARGLLDWLRKIGLDPDDDTDPILKTYDYTDERGALLFQVVRKAGHKFLQRRPGDDGQWIWNLGNTRRVPYRLPDLVACKATGNGHPWRCYVCEGEKDVDRLRRDWGVIATCNPGGAGKWRDEYDQHFTGADVIILSDNDDVGRQHALQVAKHLAKVATIVRVVELGGLPEKGDISDWRDLGGSQSDLATLIDDIPPYKPGPEPDDPSVRTRLVLAEVKSAGCDYGPIPPRRWLLGTNFCRGFLSGLTGQGAVGKSALRLMQFIAVALGRPELAGERQVKRTKVLLVSLEDDEDELRRRVRAACDGHGIDQSDLDGWLYYWTPRDLRLLDVDQFGRAKPGELGAALREIIEAYGIGLVGIDPFIKSHGAEENDNSAIDKAASLFLQVAYDCGCACDYIHHQRKGITIAGDPDGGRGASALVNASRLVKTATKMTAAEAEALGVGANERKALFRLDDAKLNLAAPSDETMWFRLIGVDIGNGDAEYPNGDNVQTVKRWYPPNIWAHLTPAVGNQILDRIADGPEPGRRYSAAAQSTKRAAWGVVTDVLPSLTKEQAQKAIATWLDAGVLINSDYEDPKERRMMQGVVVGKRPGDTWNFECGSLV